MKKLAMFLKDIPAGFWIALFAKFLAPSDGAADPTALPRAPMLLIEAPGPTAPTPRFRLADGGRFAEHRLTVRFWGLYNETYKQNHTVVWQAEPSLLLAAFEPFTLFKFY